MNEQIDLEDYLNKTKEEKRGMKINTTELLKVLTGLNKGQDQAMIGSGDSFLFHKKGIMVYSGDIIVNAEYPYIGEFMIKGDKFLKFLNKANNTDFDVVINIEEGVLTLSGDNKEISFSIYENELINPEKLLKPEDVSYYKVEQDFIDGLTFVMNTAIKHTDNTNHKVLEYIHVGTDFVEATDAQRFTRTKLTETKLPVEFLIKADKFIKVNPKTITGVGVGENFIYIKSSDNLTYAVPTSSSPFLNTQSVIDTTETEDTKEVVFNDKITETLDRLIAVYTKTVKPIITIKKNKALFTYENDGIKFKEKVDVQYDGEPFEFRFDPTTLRKAVLNSTAYVTETAKAKLIRFDNGNNTYILHISE